MPKPSRPTGTRRRGAGGGSANIARLWAAALPPGFGLRVLRSRLYFARSAARVPANATGAGEYRAKAGDSGAGAPKSWNRSGFTGTVARGPAIFTAGGSQT